MLKIERLIIVQSSMTISSDQKLINLKKIVKRWIFRLRTVSIRTTYSIRMLKITKKANDNSLTLSLTSMLQIERLVMVQSFMKNSSYQTLIYLTKIVRKDISITYGGQYRKQILNFVVENHIDNNIFDRMRLEKQNSRYKWYDIFKKYERSYFEAISKNGSL